MLAIASLWLMLAVTHTSAYGQIHDDVSNSSMAASSSGDWTQFHHDNMQRWNPNETVLGISNVGSLQMKWKNPFNVDRFLSHFADSPVVANGVVYFGSDDGNIYAFNASTGAILWSFAAEGAVPHSPAVVNGVVYATTFTSSGSNVYALNAGTGALVWRYTPSSPVQTAATVVNGVVYFGTVHSVYALNASNGALLWTHDELEANTPAVANGVVYFTMNGSTNVDALDAGTGALLWSSNLGCCSNSVSAPAVASGAVYSGSFDGNVYALNASTGAKLWSFSTGDAVSSSPAVANGVVYIGSNDGNVYALNASTGALLWRFSTGSNPTFSGFPEGVQSSPAVANGVVYVGSDNGNIYALNASTGALLWARYIGPVFFAPIVAGGVVYFPARDPNSPDMGNLFAFAPSNAQLGSADLFLRATPAPTTVKAGGLITYTFPVWNRGSGNAAHEVLTTQTPTGTSFDYIRISGTPGLGTCTTPSFGQLGPITCFQNGTMAPNTTWTVRLTVQVDSGVKPGTVITESATATEDTPDPNWANNVATASVEVLGSADLFLRVQPSTMTIHQGDLLTYAFPVWNLGPNNAVLEVLNTQVPAGTTFDYIRISGTPGLGTCSTPPHGGTGQIVCHENGSMARNTTWTVRVTVKVTASSGTVITGSAATMATTPDPNLANNTATVSLKVQ